MNVYIITEAVSGSTNGMSAQNTPAPTDEYSMNSASSLYDFENIQP
jgi:hypothetical protein